MKRRLNQLRSRLPAHVAERALPSRQKQLQTSRWLELAERCCNPQTRPSGPQQNDAAVAKRRRALRSPMPRPSTTPTSGPEAGAAARRWQSRAPAAPALWAGGEPHGAADAHRGGLGRLTACSLQQRDGKRIDHGRVPTAAQYGPSARQVRIPEKWHLRINDTRFFLLDANSDLARLRHTTYNVLDVQSGTSIADLLSNVSAWLDRCQP